MFRPLSLALALLLAGSVRAYAPCSGGQAEMSVEGVAGIFCVDGSRICIANVYDGLCPKTQPGLPNGSYCGVVATGVYGCKTNTTPAPPVATTPPPTAAPTIPPTLPPTSAPPTTPAPTTRTPSATNGSQCASSDFEMSVEGVPGIFCLAKGPICIAETNSGTCPGPQFGLPNGAYCGRVASGVYGCKPYLSAPTSGPTAGPTAGPTYAPTSPPTFAPAPTTPVPTSPPTPGPTDGSQCADGEYEMSVEGVPGVFCLANGPICMAQLASGSCPGPQYGLANGAYCGIVKSGVYGCKPNTDQTFAPQEIPEVPTSPPTPAPTPAPTAPPTLAPTPAPKPSGTSNPKSTPPSPAGPGQVCGRGATPMSIEGVATIFCVDEPACVQNRATGNCPGPQGGLPHGSYCDLIGKSGIYGCKPSHPQFLRK